MNLKRTLLHIGLALNLILVQVTAFAQESKNLEFQTVRIEGIDPSALEVKTPQSLQDEVTFTYDPQALEEAPVVEASLEKLRSLSIAMQSTNYQEELARKIVIPVSIEDTDKLNALEKLNSAEVLTFISKKNFFLAKVAKIFETLHLKVSSINKLLGLMNKQFFNNAPVIANANTRVYTLQLGMSAGIGFSDWLMNQLRKSPYLADLPDKAGFYFMFSTGVSLVRTFKDGKNKFRLEPIVDIRRATRIFSPFVIGSAGLIGSFTWENRAEVNSVQKATFYKISSLTAISGLQQFGFSGSLVAAMPPGGGLASGMEGEIYRLRLTPQSIPQLIGMIRDFIFKSKTKNCGGIFL